jgi:hypothetical protein
MRKEERVSKRQVSTEIFCDVEEPPANSPKDYFSGLNFVWGVIVDNHTNLKSPGSIVDVLIKI